MDRLSGSLAGFLDDKPCPHDVTGGGVCRRRGPGGRSTCQRLPCWLALVLVLVGPVLSATGCLARPVFEVPPEPCRVPPLRKKRGEPVVCHPVEAAHSIREVSEF